MSCLLEEHIGPMYHHHCHLDIALLRNSLLHLYVWNILYNYYNIYVSFGNGVYRQYSWPAQEVRPVRLWPDHFFLKYGVVPRACALY